MVPGRVVLLGLEAADSCEEKCKSCDERAVKLRLEWNNNLRCLGISEFWTISDWTEFELVRPSLISFDVSCHEFCTDFHFCCMTCLWVSCARKPL